MNGDGFLPNHVVDRVGTGVLESAGERGRSVGEIRDSAFGDTYPAAPISLAVGRLQDRKAIRRITPIGTRGRYVPIH